VLVFPLPLPGGLWAFKLSIHVVHSITLWVGTYRPVPKQKRTKEIGITPVGCKGLLTSSILHRDSQWELSPGFYSLEVGHIAHKNTIYVEKLSNCISVGSLGIGDLLDLG
jgi:hypothetical protein